MSQKEFRKNSNSYPCKTRTVQKILVFFSFKIRINYFETYLNLTFNSLQKKLFSETAIFKLAVKRLAEKISDVKTLVISEYRYILASWPGP